LCCMHDLSSNQIASNQHPVPYLPPLFRSVICANFNKNVIWLCIAHLKLTREKPHGICCHTIYASELHNLTLVSLSPSVRWNAFCHFLIPFNLRCTVQDPRLVHQP
jgi:hypothetical protein